MVKWNINWKEFDEWLKEKGLYNKFYPIGVLPDWERFYQNCKIQYLKEKKAETYQQVRKQSRERAIGLRQNKDERYLTTLRKAKANQRKLKSKFMKLLGNKCKQCGFHIACALEFHHITPENKWSKTTGAGYLEDPERFKKDIQEGKIELLCSNCHKIKHYNDRLNNKKIAYKHKKDFKYKGEE